jgi:DNA-binding CsgD family transcriptional regulator
MSIVNQHDSSEMSARSELNAERVSQLVRSVVAMAEPRSFASPHIPVDGTFGHVVFDVDVDGYRYLLLKTRKPEKSVISLSPREREIVRMIALGHQNKVIAAVLCISSWTVCTHVRRIFAKLDVSSRAAMVAKVTEFGCTPEFKETLHPAADSQGMMFGSAQAALRCVEEGMPRREDGDSNRNHAQAERSVTRKRAVPVR